MRQVLNKGVIVMAAASGILTVAGGYAHADASADGLAANSPGLGSGNAVQVPVHIPVNLCGNTVNVVALLNPAFGNSCANVDSGKGHHRDGDGASADGVAAHSPGLLSGNLTQVPVHIPLNVCGNTVNGAAALNPAMGNRCANVSGSHHKHGHHHGHHHGHQHNPPVDHPPVDNPPVDNPPADNPPVDNPPVDNPPADNPPKDNPPTDTPPANNPPAGVPSAHQPPAGNSTPNVPGAQLAHTGAGDLGPAAGASAALLLGGAVLMRRTRRSRRN